MQFLIEGIVISSSLQFPFQLFTVWNYPTSVMAVSLLFSLASFSVHSRFSRPYLSVKPVSGGVFLESTVDV